MADLPSPSSQQPAPSPTRAPSTRGPLGRALGFVLRKLFGGIQALITVPIILGLLYVGWLSLVYLWNYNYSTGTRTGIIRKVSYKGRPFCKFVSVQMALGGSSGQLVAAPEIWEFTIDDDRDEAPLRQALETAARSQKLTTVRYRQDMKNLPWRWCVDTQYHAIKVE